MAAMIGIRGSSFISLTKAKGYLTYRRIYAMYAVMMTCSGLAHCIVPSSNSALFNFIVTYLDLALTSSIAFHFALAALADFGLDESGCIMQGLFAAGEVLIFGLWLWFGYIHPSTNAFWYLYVGIIAISCSAYVIFQTILLCCNKFRGFGWLASGAVAGGVGLWCALNRGLLCAKFGANFGASFWWDAFSNIAMLALAGYYLNSRDLPYLAALDDAENAMDVESATQENNEPAPPSYHDLSDPHAFQAPPAYGDHPQVVYIPLQVYPVPRED